MPSALAANTVRVSPSGGHRVFRKVPLAAEWYAFDFTDVLGSGETLSTATWVEGGLTAGSTSQVSPYSEIRLSGGTDGNNYSVSVSITTSASRTVTGQLTIQVRATLP